MKQLLFAFCIIFSTTNSYANSSWGCNLSKKNVTLFFAFEYYDSNYKPGWKIYNDTNDCNKIQKAFLKKIVNDLDLDDYPFQINIYVDRAPLPLERSVSGLDDLLGIGYNISNKNKPVLEIIFQHSRLDHPPYQYSRIYSLVKYAVENIDAIKKTQKRIFIPGTDTSEKDISITTIDTALIQSIPTEQFNFDPAKALKRKNIAFPISIFAALIGAFVAIFAGTAAKRKKLKPKF